MNTQMPTMPALRILPGLDGTGRLSQPFLEALADTGIADAEVVPYPVDRLLDYAELERFARSRLPHDRPFVLLAESFSGPVGIRIAADPPPGLVGLILSTTFARSPLPGLSSLTRLLRFAPVHAVPAWALSPLLLGHWGTPAMRTSLIHAIRRVDPQVLRMRMALALRADVHDRLAAIRLPTAVFCAGRDRLLPSSTSARLAAKITTARLQHVDGPHLLLQTRADACAAIVADFLASISAITGVPPLSSTLITPTAHQEG